MQNGLKAVARRAAVGGKCASQQAFPAAGDSSAFPEIGAPSRAFKWIDGKKTRAEILEKEKASAIYEGIVRRLQDPGLLEYIDSDVFRARVFPVPARGEQKVELAFSQVLDFAGGSYRYRYPLGAGGRWSVPPRVRHDFTFSASLASKVPLRSIDSPTHPLQVSRKGEHGAVVGLELGPGAELARDLDLFYAVSEKAIGLSLLTFKEASEPGYFLALLSPKHELQQDEILGKRITFTLDTSGSMAGERLAVARLSPKDRFNVVRFATDVEALFEVPREPARRRSGRRSPSSTGSRRWGEPPSTRRCGARSRTARPAGPGRTSSSSSPTAARRSARPGRWRSPGTPRPRTKARAGSSPSGSATT